MLTVRRTPRQRVAVPAVLGSLESVAALVLAHVAAGGEVPQPLWLAAFGALVYAASGPVLRRRAGIRVVLPALVVVQVLGHAWLVALSPATHAGHGHDGAMLLGLSPSMLAAHGVAAVVTGVMWSLRRRATEVLLGWARTGVLPVPSAPRLPARTRLVVPRSAWLVAATPTRGPPVVVPATARA
ncbi:MULTISPECIES: hypothetical protein [unclassified Nocardioides]|uniref:hypothetical protein n=1 Tax=unclassified Nocardioides TaxID=2615069 RepID=UPI000702A6AB|nr:MULTISPECIES: hypothetical protein [unclassified Nocardioides]KRC46360.1 hypothetical protein ASE19_21235 [Nocardioides sp. Root79]KRC69707.1 hypothetical protein ASE20_14095 [Nocardioides sp. Root240]